MLFEIEFKKDITCPIGYSPEAFRNVQKPFIAIAPRSTLTRSGSNC